jgi:hypothetical protein
MTLFLIDLIDGKVTEEEKQHMRKYLLKIMRQANRPYGGVKNIEDQLDSNSKINIPKTE